VHLGEGLVEISDHPAHAVMAPKDRPLPSHQPVQRRVPLDLGMEFVQQTVDISTVSRLEPALEGLHVLLRHRPRSISRKVALSMRNARLQN
jgi:hypothetical protein